MINAEIEDMRAHAREVLARPEAARILSNPKISPVWKGFEIAILLEDFPLIDALSFNHRTDWCAKVNCYRYALKS